MPVDASIYSLIRQPQALPNPLEQYGQMLTMKQLMGQGQIQDRAISQAQAEDAAWQASGGNLENYKPTSYQSAAAVGKYQAEKKKNEADLFQNDLKTIAALGEQGKVDLIGVLNAADPAAAYNDILGKTQQNFGMLMTDRARIMASRGIANMPKTWDPITTPKWIKGVLSETKGYGTPEWKPAIAGGKTTFYDPKSADRPADIIHTPVPKDYGGLAEKPLTPAQRLMKEKDERKVKQTKISDTQNLSKVNASLDAFLDEINHIIGSPEGSKDKKIYKEHPGLGRAVGPLEGSDWYPSILEDTVNADALIKALKSKSSIQGLSAIRGTGGAVGSITEKEWPIFQDLIAALSTRQGKEQFIEQLKKLRDEVYASKRRYQIGYDDMWSNKEYTDTMEGDDEGAPMERKVIGGKSYVKQNGQWFSE